MGRRAANQTAVWFAAFGTAACGLSNSMEMLIAARFVSSPLLCVTAVVIEDRSPAWAEAAFSQLRRKSHCRHNLHYD